ncbi:7033_t:CDS:1, partial [Funneliformis caledonium]
YFRQLFQHINTTAKTTNVTVNVNRKQGKKKRRHSKYKLTILNEDVDVTCLPT